MTGLMPCRECGAPCSVQVFTGPNVEGTLWMCERHKSLGGHCPSDKAYFTAEAWNTRAPDPRYGKVHTDGSHSGGQPIGTNADAVDRVIAAIKAIDASHSVSEFGTEYLNGSSDLSQWERETIAQAAIAAMQPVVTDAMVEEGAAAMVPLPANTPWRDMARACLTAALGAKP